MRILVLTTLYPNAIMPSHGVFVENRLRAFKDVSKADIRVIAPVPWFPSGHKIFRSWGHWANIPEHETRHGIDIVHPRYALIPKIGMSITPIMLEKTFAKAAQELLDDGFDFDLIDAHYFYPDGVAAVNLATKLGKPITVTARGTDINLIPQYPRQKAMILKAVAHADAAITVAEALRTEMIDLGAAPEKIHTLRNGVDLDLFQPSERNTIRQKMGLSGPVIASVGHLIERKGHHLVIEALKQIPDATLLIAGDGPDRARLQQCAEQFQLSDRVNFLGAVPHEALPDIYTASDVLALASSREGWPNVLLEAMACGCPCVASPVWGSGEVITDQESGQLAKNRSADAMATAISSVLSKENSRQKTRAYAERFSWEETSQNLNNLFSNIIKTQKIRDNIFYKPAIIDVSRKRPRMIITVDTEERFDWENYTNTGYEVCDPEYIAKFQKLSESHQIKPLYFITQPLMETNSTAEYFKSVYTSGRANLGLHLHQWVTRPEAPYNTPWYSFQKNLPKEIHQEKLQSLISSFRQAFEFTPTAHRAGRYGIAPENYALFAKLGITHDFSPSVGFDFSHEGGPNFSHQSNQPYHIETEHRPISILPVCGASVMRHTRKFFSLQNDIGFSSKRNRTNSVSKNIPRIAMRLSPEGTELEDLLALAKHLVATDTPILTFTLHSTSLTPGATSYAPTKESVAAFLDRSDKFFKTFSEDMGGEFIGLEEIETLLKP